MSSHKLHKRCPRCKRKRTYTVPSDHQFPTGCEWEQRDGVWICAWCVAREKPDGEAKLREELKKHRKHRKEHRKEHIDLMKSCGFPTGRIKDGRKL